MTTAKKITSFRAIIFYYMLLLLLPMSFLNFGCKKKDIHGYLGKNLLYFGNGDNPLYSNGDGVYKYNNFIFGGDTIQTSPNDRFIGSPVDRKKNKVVLYATGKSSNENRLFKLKVEGDAKDLAILPPPDSLYMPAGQDSLILEIKFKRPPVNDTTEKSFILSAEDNEYFTPSKIEWSKITIKFGNTLPDLPWSNNDVAVFGDFSTAKVYAIVDAINEKGEAYWTTHQNDINQYLDKAPSSRFEVFVNYFGANRISFYPFSIDDLMMYHYLQISARRPPPVSTFYNEAAKVTKAYLEKKRAEGNPIKDTEGNEITIP